MSKTSYFNIVLSIAIIIIAFSVFYYYIFFLPKQNQLELKLEQDKFNYQVEKDMLENKQEEQEKKRSIEENYTKECEGKEEENLEKYEEFINTCVNAGNSIDFCIDSPAGHILYKSIGKNFIEGCVKDKLNGA